MEKMGASELVQPHGADRRNSKDFANLPPPAEWRQLHALGPVPPRGNWIGLIPLSYAQERLWFLEQLGGVRTAYNMQISLRLEGNLDAEALNQTFAELVRRHESLRTRFGEQDGFPHQLIGAPTDFRLRRSDIGPVADLRERERLVRQWAQREQTHAFDLKEGPLFRATLLRLDHCDHALFVTMHHIIADGWSRGVLHRELSALYAAYARGRPSPLPDLSVQYADYAIWQRMRLTEAVLKKQLQFWSDQLIGAPPQLEFRTESRPSMDTLRGGRACFELPRMLILGLREMGRSMAVTPFMIFLAAYQVLLSRYSDQKDIVVGTPMAGRSTRELEDVIGCFVNMLVLRTNVSGSLSFRQLLQQVKEMTLDAYEHQDLPFELLVKELRPERHLTRQPIFQVAMSLQNFPQEPLTLPGLTWTMINAEHATAPFDLTLHLFEMPDGMRGEFAYSPDLFNPITIERMAAHFRTLLEAILNNPDCPVHRLQILTTQERQQVLYGFNDTATQFPQHALIHQLFEERVLQSPNAVAVLDGGRTLTYAELNAKANRLACHILKQGACTGEYIPVCMTRSAQSLIAQLAILKSGAAYVPIDPTTTPERQDFIIRDCGARTVLVDDRNHDALKQEHLRWIDCSTGIGDTSEETNFNQSVPIESPPAYVMYTSGSTGFPKGVVVPHRAVNRLVINNNYARIEPSDCVAYCSNPAFDASTFEVWGALLNGASVLIVPQWQLLDADQFAQLLIKHNVTVLWLTVGLFTQYAEALAPAFRQLRFLMTGGDVVEPAVVNRVLRNSPPRQLLNGYGPTECTTFSTVYPITTPDDDMRSMPIGRPIANSRIYILDSHLQPVPIGVTGDIYIAGAGLALGYLGRPELTSDRFVSDPFTEGVHARMYRSGDLGRWNCNGTIEFVGRNDRQVKIRGFRVELGEIEAQLVRFNNVKEAVVLATDMDAGTKRLVAYITSREPLKVKELRSHLSTTLPEYMIPSAFVILERLPLTPNGKLDRRELPPPQLEEHASEEFEAPLGVVEQKLAALWEELLKVTRVGRRDNFFDLGGHSLLAVKALSRINQSFACDLSVRDVYQSPLLQELAVRICGSTIAEDFLDLSQEAQLDEGMFETKSNVDGGAPHAALLTGGTGFVGRFLLAELLRCTDAKVYCLVRAPSSAQALRRIRDSLVECRLWRDHFESRIVAITGDLSLPHLGLNERDHHMLSESVGSIFHCATSMNHLETYAAAKPVNVDATRELLKFSMLRRTKLLNYISTLSVFRPSSDSFTRVADETTTINGERHSTSNGYAASKWVAEKIVMIAEEHGVPCNIFRLGLVWADTQHGYYDEMQRESMVIRSSLLSGYGIENYRYDFAPTPVDYVARAVAHLANKHIDGGGIFHIASREQMDNGLFERCNQITGTCLELVPLYDWIREIKGLHYAGWSLPIVPLIQFAFSMNRESFDDYQRRTRSRKIHFECTRTHQELELAGIVAPVLNDDLLKTCVDNMLAEYARTPRARGSLKNGHYPTLENNSRLNS